MCRLDPSDRRGRVKSVLEIGKRPTLNAQYFIHTFECSIWKYLKRKTQLTIKRPSPSESFTTLRGNATDAKTWSVGWLQNSCLFWQCLWGRYISLDKRTNRGAFSHFWVPPLNMFIPVIEAQSDLEQRWSCSIKVFCVVLNRGCPFISPVKAGEREEGEWIGISTKSSINYIPPAQLTFHVCTFLFALYVMMRKYISQVFCSILSQHYEILNFSLSNATLRGHVGHTVFMYPIIERSLLWGVNGGIPSNSTAFTAVLLLLLL